MYILLPEGHVGVLRADAELPEEAYHVGVVLLVKYHKPSAAEEIINQSTRMAERSTAVRHGVSLPARRQQVAKHGKHDEDRWD